MPIGRTRGVPAQPPDPGLRLLDDIDAVVWEADASTEPLRFTYVGGRTEAILGYPAARWLTEPGFWVGCIHPEDRACVTEFLRGIAREGTRGAMDFRVRTADGSIVWLRDRVHGLAPAGGRPPRLRGVMTDVSAHRLAEARLQASEARKSAIVAGALDCIVTVDHRGIVLDFNPAAERTFGYRRAEAVGGRMADLIVPPEHRDAHVRGLARYLETGDARILGRRLEITAMRADGSQFPVELSITRVPGSEPPVFTGFLRDITERRRAEQDLQGTLSLLAATLESTADGILVVDSGGHIVSLNRRFAAMWHIPEGILAARDDERAIAFVLSQLRDPDAFVAKVRELYAQPDAESFDVLEFKDGRVFERYSMPQQIDGRSVGRVWSFRDVTARREAEAALREREDQLRQSQKMDAIGRLAGGIAHDFNNLLTVILGYTDQMLERLAPGDALRGAAQEVQEAAERAAALTRQLLAFSRKQILELRVLDLNRTVEATGGMLRRLIGEDIELEMALEPRLGRVHADEHQMQQVIMNLAINARDAMPHGGRLTLATGNLDVDDSLLPHPAPLRPGRYVMLIVRDTGIGMDLEARSRVFEPFFTTKERGKGTGLGLATVYGIVRQTGGDIRVESEPGRGAEFCIYLPRIEETAVSESSAEPALPATRLPRGTETVLVAENETTVRNLMRDVLEQHGYRVLAAGSGEEALALAAGLGGALHVLVTDVIMPGMRGPDLAHRLAGAHPGMRVLYVSGYPDDEVLAAGVREGHLAFLQKPFTREAIVSKVRELLDSPRLA